MLNFNGASDVSLGAQIFGYSILVIILILIGLFIIQFVKSK